jgi:hypothetical protein
MSPVLEQATYATVAKYQSRTCTAVFERPTLPGNLLVVVNAAAGTLPSGLTTPTGFTRITPNPSDFGLRDIQAAVWYRQNAPATSYVSVTTEDAEKSQQIRAFEFSGMAQATVLDKVTYRLSEDRDPYTGSSGTIAIADELVMAFVINQYASTSQSGFTGGLARWYDSTSPQKYGSKSNQDWERSRLTVHAAGTTTTGSFSLSCDLSTTRRWIAVLVTFRGGTIGPARMTSTGQPPALETSARGDLTVFGPLTSISEDLPAALVTTVLHARIGPFYYQYRMGGWDGLLIGSGTKYHVEGTDGLGGWQVRTSDDDLPRGDGALRGIDLQAAREVVFRMNVGRGRDEVERNMAAIFRALVPQRDEDWELLFRFPTEPLKMMRVRPIDLMRARNSSQIELAAQQFALRAADPRHYAAVPTQVEIPVTPAGAVEPQRVQVTNIGNSPAYPTITVTGPTSGAPVTRLQLVNETALVVFEAELLLLPGAVLVADMDARITGAPRSPITVDNQSKYGAWQLPREPFRIDPDPTGYGGYNELYLTTEPTGAPVTCRLDFRSTWAG